MASSWPTGVTSMDDMHRFAKTLFGKSCAIEDLLKGTPFWNKERCHLIRVKNACSEYPWNTWPELIDEAMSETVKIQNNPKIIMARGARQDQGPRARLYDTIQVTPTACTCRIPFGADSHQKTHCTGSSSTSATIQMDKMLMNKFQSRQQWAHNQSGYHEKAFHIVLNRYNRDDGIGPHHDISKTYDARNPITSLSYGRGSILTIHSSDKQKMIK